VDIHVVAWELTRKINGMKPLTKCAWPEPGFEPESGVPEAAGE
jgi:hypothetical protein